ncbi:MAG: nucleotide-binding protein [Deltaproteobacteria bacterium]|nr:nucleotide-binding protein [Deltaproteobacteria bacterium]
MFGLADKLKNAASRLPEEDLARIEDVANSVGKAWSGSCLGYHSRVYYKDLQPVPPGARFSKEWGFSDSYVLHETVGDWEEYDFDDVVSHIKSISGIEDLNPLEDSASEARELFDEIQSEVLSLLTPILLENKDDTFLSDLVEKIKGVKIYTPRDYLKSVLPSGQQMSRDMNAIQAGSKVPPHISVLSSCFGIRGPFTACLNLSKMTRRLASHMENVDQSQSRSERVGTNVFIGHGRASLWRDLKDFIQDRLHLPWDEFNRVPVAGFTNIARLSEMIDNAAIAFIIMTAEDEQVDGKMHARMNVIHEAGLFQGRLGFEKAILVLEEGCEEFSNVQGLGQIRFPTGNISAVFEEIRIVLEREQLIE